MPCAFAGQIRVPVVLAEEDHRQPPDRGEVDGLVELALPGEPPLPKKATATDPSAPSSSTWQLDGDWEPGRHDAVLVLKIPSVGSAMCIDLPWPRLLPLDAHQLGEHGCGVEAFGEAVGVTVVGRGDHVGSSEVPACPDRRRLLADREVDEPGDLAVRGTSAATRSSNPRITSIRLMHLEEVGVR